jgi:hypothetical protein
MLQRRRTNYYRRTSELGTRFDRGMQLCQELANEEVVTPRKYLVQGLSTVRLNLTPARALQDELFIRTWDRIARYLPEVLCTRRFPWEEGNLK